MRHLTSLFLGLLLAATSWAADELISDVRYSDDGGFARTGIVLGMPVEIAGTTIDPNGTLRIRLTATGSSGSPGWSAVEMGFTERPRLLAQVALEGSDRQGYELVVEFSQPVDVELLPAPDARLILLRMTPRAPRAMPVAFAVTEAPAIPASPPPPAPVGVQRAPAIPTAAASEDLETRARAASEAGNYEEAIRLYTQMMSTAQGAELQRAHELLGVSREQNHQLAHAKSLYESYLKKYPGTDGARRVQQRLAALVAVAEPRNAPRRSATRRAPDAWAVSSYLSQFYERQSIDIGQNSSVPIEGIFSDAGVTATRDGADVDQQFRLTMSHLLDFSGLDRLDGREYQVSSAYWDGFSDHLRSGLRIGRQSRSRAGVLGRFDGVVFTHRPSEHFTVDLTGGLLLDYAFDSPNTDRPFFGISGEWVADSGNFRIAPFFVQQEFDGVLDRQAVGLQSEMQADNLTLFTLVDYDVHYGELNNLTFTGNFRVRNSEVSASYEHRMSPYLTTRNALIGQPYRDLSDLENAIIDLQLDDLAVDRTATSETIRLALTTPLSQNWAISADVVASDLSSTNTSGDVVGLEPYQTLYSSIQVRSTDLLGPGSYSALMLRRAESDAGGTTSMFWDNRFGMGERWFVYPRIRVDYRSFDSTDDSQWSTRPSLRLDFRYSEKMRFEFEAGYLSSAREMATGNVDITGVFLRAGYHASF